MQLPKSKLPHVGTTIFTEMSALAAETGALNMSQGFPDFDPPEDLRKAVVEAMNSGKNQYAPMAGDWDLRAWIAEETERRTQHRYDVNTEITIGAGASSLLFASIQAWVNPGDEVIVLAPAYDLYQPAVELAQGHLVVVPLNGSNYHLDLHAIQTALSPATRMIILNVPNNPTGSSWSEKDLAALDDLLHGTDIIVLSDEVYAPMQYDGRSALSLSNHPRLSERALVAASFGKILHATGWKIGYLLGPVELMKEVRKIHQYDVFSTGAPLQAGIASFLNSPSGQNHLIDLPAFYQEKRDRFLNGLVGSRWNWSPAESGYFQILDYGDFETQEDSRIVQTWCKKGPKDGIALIPLSSFYPSGIPENHSPFRVRVCFAKNGSTLDEGVRRLLLLSNPQH
jgi:methionine aminotransferase